MAITTDTAPSRYRITSAGTSNPRTESDTSRNDLWHCRFLLLDPSPHLPVKFHAFHPSALCPSWQKTFYRRLFALVPPVLPAASLRDFSPALTPLRDGVSSIVFSRMTITKRTELSALATGDAPSCKTRREVSLVQLETRAEEEPPGAAPFLMMCCIARNGSYAAGHRDSDLRRCGRDRDRRWLWNWEGVVRGNERARCRSGGGQDFCNSVRVKSQRLRNKEVPGAARKTGRKLVWLQRISYTAEQGIFETEQVLANSGAAGCNVCQPRGALAYALPHRGAAEHQRDLLIRSLPTRA
jgi:hypothetical protein